MESIDYKKASSFYLIGNLFNKGMAFLTVPIFTRILSTKDYGIVTTYNSWIIIISMVMGLAIHMAIRSAFVDYKENIDDFMSVTTTFIIASGVSMGFCIIIGYFLLQVSLSFTLVILCAFQGLATALVQNYSMYLMMQFKFKFRTALIILPNVLSVIFSIIAILFVVKVDLYFGRIVPTAIVNILAGCIIILLVYKKSHSIVNKKYLKYALTISAPLVLHGIALTMLSQSDRTMITWFVGASQTGIYSLIYNFSMIATVITTSLDGVWVPWFIKKLENHEIGTINEKAIEYIKLVTYSMVILILLGPEVVKVLASAEYLEGTKIIPPIVLSNYVIFAYTMYVNVEHYYKKTLYITYNTLIAASINILLNFILIPKYSYVAAAYTTLVSYIIAFVFHAKYAKRLEVDLYPLKLIFKPLLHITISVVLFYVFLNHWIIRWTIICLYIIVIFFKERDKTLAFLYRSKIKHHR